MKKKLFQGVAITIILIVLMSSSVFAGTINSNESRVIAEASGSFKYNGKIYVSTQGALAQLRAYVSQDSVDLTSAQANKAINMMYGSVKKGIDGGYIVEVGSNSSSDTSRNDAISQVIAVIGGTPIINNNKVAKGKVTVEERTASLKVRSAANKTVYKAQLPIKDTGFSINNLKEAIIAKVKMAIIMGSPECAYSQLSKEHSQTKGTIKFSQIDWPEYGTQYGVISCAELKLKAPLYYGDSPEVLEKGAGQYATSSFPGQGKGILVGGHDITYFAPLENVKNGQVFKINTSYGQYRYQVIATEIAKATDYIMADLDKSDEKLVLYTCYPFGDILGPRDKRLFVYLDKIDGLIIEEAGNEKTS